MNGEWRRVQLGDVLVESREKVRVESSASYPVAGVRIAGGGLFWRETLSGSATNYDALYRLRDGQLVYRKLTAWEGPITVVTPEFDGAYVSSEFPTFTLDRSELLPEFMSLVCELPSFHDDMKALSSGTAERRNRLAPADLLKIEIDLPPITEQRRTIEAVSVVDRTLRAYRRRVSAAQRAHTSAREELIEATDFERLPLSEVVLSVRGGKSPKCLDRRPVANEYGVLKVSAIRDGQFRPDEAKALPEGANPEAPSVRAGDLLYSRANTAALVGAVCRVERDYPRLLLCDKTMRLTVKEDLVDPDFLVEAVGTTSPREHIETAAGGTSESMKNISQAAFLATEVAVPSLAVQSHVASALKTLRRARAAAEHRQQSLVRFRMALLEELLNVSEQSAVG